jgi:hypothetical protein
MKTVDTTNYGTFYCSNTFDSNGSSSGYHTVTLKKKEINWN